MVAGDWRANVPSATVGRPHVPGAVVGRGPLVQRLPAVDGPHLVVMTAPAGYGKTTAALQWDDADERPFAWLRVDYLDDDPAHLMLHIATAVAEIRPVDSGVLTYLRGPGRAPLTHLVPAVVGVLERVGPLVLVVDDAHELSDPDAIRVLSALIDAAPASTTVALIGRYRLPVEIARRRLQGDVAEVGVDSLRLSDEESAEVLASVSGPLDDETAATVVDRCEGWAAGLTLAAMALRDGAAVDSITGRQGLVVDYLVEEVLDRLDADMTEFLLESSVWDRFTADQLDEALGRTDSGPRLQELADSGNLFLVALDDDRVCYRYHRLFGDALRYRLRRSAPGRYREVASRIADLLEREGDIDGALVHAVEAGDRARAAALVNREAVRLGFDGRVGVLARRLGMFDSRTIAEHADAAVARAWYGVTTGDAEMIQRSLMLAHRADAGRPLADGTPSVTVAAALIGSLVGRGGVKDVLCRSEAVRDAGDSLVNPWWGAATVMKGAAEAMLGHGPRARILLESALPATDDLPGFQAAALAHLALLDLGAGDDESAAQRIDAASTLADKYDLCDVVPTVVVYSVRAVMAARVGDALAARDAICIAERLLDRLGQLAARTALLGHGLLAWTGAALQDSELLHRHLDAADRARLREPDAIALAQRVDRVRAMAAGGNQPLTAAELRLLPHLATHFSLQRIAEELVIGRETAKSQAAAIYRKLGVSSRTEAVAEARRVGLLAS